MNKRLILASAIALLGFTGSALAADGVGGQGFIRGELGSTNTKLSAEGESDSEDDVSYGVRGGYYFNKNFAVEGFYNSYYSKSQDGVSIDLDGVGAGVAGKLYFAEGMDTGWFVSGRAGAVRLKAKISVDGFGSGSDHETKPYAGVGLGYDFSRNLGLSLNYDYVKADYSGVDIKLQTAAAALEYRF